MAGEDIWSPNSQIPRIHVRTLWLAVWILALVFILSPWGYRHLTNPKIITPVTSTSWAQDIWVLILGLQTIGLVYQLLPGGYDPDGDKQRSVNTVGSRWAATGICLLAWLTAGAASTPATTWLSLAAVLLATALQMQTLHKLCGLRAKFGRAPKTLYILYFFPTSLMAAWLMLVTATTALSAMIIAVDADDLNVVSVLFMAAVVATGAVVVIRHRDTAFGLTLLWGFVGIYEASKDRGADLAVQYAALGAVALVTILCLASVLRRRPPNPSVEDEADLEAQQPLRSQEL